MYSEKAFKQARKRAKAHLKKLTLQDKMGQLIMRALGDTSVLGVSLTSGLGQQVREGKVGAIIHCPSVEFRDAAKELQRIAVEESPAKIPLLVNADVIHGFETVFPMPLAAAASFNPDVAEVCGRVAATEASVHGIHWTNSPMVDISRDPRWGRIVESSGEDPYLSGEMGKGYVRGFQGDDLTAPNAVMACMKHFAAYGGAVGGRDYDGVDVGENTMRNVYLRPFRECVRQGVASVMTSFNTVDNIPMTCNKKYIYDVLRKEFGFDGIALSDAGSVDEIKTHGLAKTDADATKLCLLASLDMDLSGDCFTNGLPEAVASNKRFKKALDESVLRILTMKYLSGIMDDPYRHFNDAQAEKVYCKEHIDLARQAAEQCIVLLENDGSLPIQKKTVHLTGPFANNRDLLGCWQASSRKAETQTILEALQEKGANVVYTDWTDEESTLAAAKQADVTVAVIGDEQDTTGEARSRSDLSVHPAQLRLLESLRATNATVITLIHTARPILLAPLLPFSNALMLCGDLGSGAGMAIANTLLGDNVPGGKLPVTYPATQGQIPTYYNRLHTGRPYREGVVCCLKYIDGPITPLYPFGYGLSYTKFTLGKIGVSAKELSQKSPIVFSVDVSNDGNYDGYETVMLFLNDPVASAARAERELVAFEKIYLKQGESKTVFFVVDKDTLAFYGADNRLTTEKGKYLLWASNGVEETERAEIFYK